MIELAGGNIGAAARQFRKALDFSLEHQIVGTATELIDAAASVTAASGDPELSARLFGAADRLNRETGNPITLPESIYYSNARDHVRETMTVSRFNELQADGAAMSLDQGFALARTALETIAITTQAEMAAEPDDSSASTLGLTNREVEVLRLVAMGLSDREVGDRLFISHGTARTHVRNILGKLGVHSRTAATSIALRERLIGPER